MIPARVHFAYVPDPIVLPPRAASVVTAESPPTAVDAPGCRGASGAVGTADWQAVSRKRLRATRSRRMRYMVVSWAGSGTGSGV